MKKIIVVLVMMGLVFGVSTVALAAEEKAVVEKAVVEKEKEATVTIKGGTALETAFEPFWVYRDKADRANHYVPSGWMGDYGAIQMDDNYKGNAKSGMTCIKFAYTGDITQGAGWAGVYWQNPANNWGFRKGGFNLTGASKVTFWARGEKGGEVISKLKFGGITGEFSDTDSVEIGPINLTTEWRQYTIDLTGCDLSYISGGFCWVASRLDNSEVIVFYLDDIRYE